MKKIKSIKQLKAEKRRLRKRKSELEEKIKTNWGSLKQNFFSGKSEKNYSAGTDNGKEEHANKQDGFLESLFAFVAKKFARKMAGKAEDKFGQWFRK
jgi:hypothetical protein